MKHMEEFDEDSILIAMLSFSPISQTFIADSVWDPDTYSVTNQYVNRSARTNEKVAKDFAQRRIDVNDIDYFHFLADKDKVDSANAIKSEERDKMIAGAASATMAGGHATLSAARDTAPLLEGVRAGDDVGLKGGVGDDGRRACNAVGRTGHGSSPGGGEGRRRRRPQGWRR